MDLRIDILREPMILDHWRKLYRNYSDTRDARATDLANIVSRLSRAEIDLKPLGANPYLIDILTSGDSKHIQNEDISGAADDQSDLEPELEEAHRLCDSGDFIKAKRILVKLVKSKQMHISSWAQYFLGKCLYDQYQLVAALSTCQNLLSAEAAPFDVVARAQELMRSIQDGLNYQVETCSSHIKPSFYHKQLLKMRPLTTILLETSYECYLHYQRVGFRLGINPTPWFETRTYLKNNQDISHAGCCPFFHYLAAGQKEGRIAADHGSRFSSQVRNQASLTKDLYEEARGWLKTLECDKQLSDDELAKLLETPYVLSISHDSYYSSPGGIQLCIQREQLCFEKKGIQYVHIYPRQPSPMPLHERNPYSEIVVSRNGVKQGISTMHSFWHAISCYPSEAFVIHSLLGISPEDIVLLISQCPANVRLLYWMHDYSALCSSYQLLRNKVSFCGAPSLDSKQCTYCFFGNSRIGNVRGLSMLLGLPQAEVIFPSHAALTVWRNGADASSLMFPTKYSVINHICLNRSESISRDYEKRLPRIGYLGHPTYAKGWDTFESLIRDPELFNRFDWFHLGATTASLSADIEFVDVNISDSLDAMIRGVRDAEIDFALIWPQWPETFCLTAYEAVIGGANIITNVDSGNVAAFAASIPYGHVLKNDYSTLKSFLLDLTSEMLLALSFPYQVEYEYSQMTAEMFQ
ncbi:MULTISPECIES: hypothetical protein [unclassified Cyanobium]|uniref:hypothetical protein n=1 Tax=unclassified Cyanobium TaxID=2627006 RepID=UPI0020CCA825|nr:MULTISPECIES: hypothetical protein [unclassified Cyanobium]